jgi:hypothetical protein
MTDPAGRRSPLTDVPSTVSGSDAAELEKRFEPASLSALPIVEISSASSPRLVAPATQRFRSVAPVLPRGSPLVPRGLAGRPAAGTT